MSVKATISANPSKQALFSVALLTIVHGANLTVVKSTSEDYEDCWRFDRVLFENMGELQLLRYTQEELAAMLLYAIEQIHSRCTINSIEDCIDGLLSEVDTYRSMRDDLVGAVTEEHRRADAEHQRLLQCERNSSRACETIADCYEKQMDMLHQATDRAISQNHCLKKQVAALQAQVQELQALKTMPVSQPSQESDLVKLAKPLANLLRPFF